MAMAARTMRSLSCRPSVPTAIKEFAIDVGKSIALTVMIYRERKRTGTWVIKTSHDKERQKITSLFCFFYGCFLENSRKRRSTFEMQKQDLTILKVTYLVLVKLVVPSRNWSWNHSTMTLSAVWRFTVNYSTINNPACRLMQTIPTDTPVNPGSFLVAFRWHRSEQWGQIPRVTWERLCKWSEGTKITKTHALFLPFGQVVEPESSHPHYSAGCQCIWKNPQS